MDGEMTKNDLKNMYSVDENQFYCLKRGHKVFFLQFIVIASSGTVVMLAYLDSNPTGRNTN